MTDASPQEGAGTRRGAAAWLIATWVCLVIGLGLVAEGAVLYTHARASEAGPSWIVGMAAILIGAALSLSGVYAIYARSRPADPPLVGDLPIGREASVPLLGALLVYKYHLLTEEELEQALEVQRRQGTSTRRIGGVLLDMGLISSADLQKALDYQRTLAPPEAGTEGAT